MKDPTLLPDLKALVESTTRGDPESPLLWTARSQRNLVAALTKRGHSVSTKLLARLLKDLGYSLQANRKRMEGAQHPIVTHSSNTSTRRRDGSSRPGSPRSRWTPRRRSSWGRG